MTRERFVKIKEYMSRHRALFRVMEILANAITVFVFAVYPILLIWLFVNIVGGTEAEPVRLVWTVGVPAAAFVLLSNYREKAGAKRPYEIWDETPLIKKDTKENSFPSRHVFSIYMIGMTVFCYFKPLGVVICIMGIYLAFFRVISGVHFIKDVLAGALAGILAGLLLMAIL